MLDPAACTAAMLKRDPAYDGVFFIGVRTTLIYCRPVCRVKMPKLENVRFYPSAAAAERAGHRPCLRCRPESAPFSPAWKGSKTTVERALNLIEGGALNRANVGHLAERLGIGPRHLSRLFAKHVDASPLQVERTLSVQRAVRLLRITGLNLGEIAERAGFSTADRMSIAFRALYGCSPSTFRRREPAAARRAKLPIVIFEGTQDAL